MTKHQIKIFKMLSKGYTNKDIADKELMNLRTIERRIHGVNSELGSNNTMESVATLVRSGVI